MSNKNIISCGSSRDNVGGMHAALKEIINSLLSELHDDNRLCTFHLAGLTSSHTLKMQYVRILIVNIQNLKSKTQF